ncbi:helix-turn-helix transcriptional regulator [Sandarakinorhabdus glacialis]|nr:helix-turn-helix transcriptional regulator [Polymorphobacter glacialis]
MELIEVAAHRAAPREIDKILELVLSAANAAAVAFYPVVPGAGLGTVIAAAGRADRSGIYTPEALAGLLRHSLLEQIECSSHALVIGFEPTPAAHFALCLLRDPGQSRFTRTEARALNRLYPWLAGWIDLWCRNQRQSSQAHALRSAMSASPFGIMLVGADCHLFEANRSAHALLADGDGLLQADRRVRAVLRADQLRLADTVGSVAEDGRPSGMMPPVLQIRRQGRHPLAVAAMPVERAGNDDDPSVILYIVDPELDVQPLLAGACQLYGFRPTETRLVHHLVAGRSLGEAATRMRVQHETARVYLKQVFSKTGVHRQANLVRLMLLSMMPVPGDVDRMATAPPNRVADFSERGASKN